MALNELCSTSDFINYLTDFKNDVKDTFIQTFVDEIARVIHDSDSTPKECYQRSEMMLHYVWEKMNTGRWDTVDVSWRKLYSILSLMKAFYTIKLYNNTPNFMSKANEFEILQDLVKICDIACLMGAPVMNNLCAEKASQLNQTLASHELNVSIFNDDEEVKSSKKMKLNNPLTTFKNLMLLEESDCPSLEKFIKFRNLNQPIKIVNAINHWPAIGDSLWNINYLSKTIGFRTVPIEIGKRYTDDSWTQTLMTVNEFVKKYISNPNPPSVGYLAQHEFQDQFIEIENDFETPEYCYTGEEPCEDVATNIWFGPGGTVSPLHTDPRHNCLCQIFGQKYVKLYPQDQTDFVYPFPEAHLMSNTSQLDLEKDFEEIVQEFPKFSEAKGYECVLNPGDMLYIPPKCWHFVKSLSTSCSLSFWFD